MCQIPVTWDHRAIPFHALTDDQDAERPWNPYGPPPRHFSGHGHRPARFRRRGPWRRVDDDRLVGGVAAAVGRRFGVDVTVVRVVFVLFLLSGGVGAFAYMLGWLFIPLEGEDETIANRALADRRTIVIAAVVVLPLVILFAVVTAAIGNGLLKAFATCCVVGTGGLIIVWRDGGERDKAAVQRCIRPAVEIFTPGGGRGKWTLVVRLGVGFVLLVAGLTALSLGHGTIHAAVRLFVGVLLVVGALVAVFGPWWLRLARDLVSERQARARAEERAELAARVHDSVLQTLALIQRQADDPQRVVQLARGQERELRSWLFDGTPPGSENRADRLLSEGLKRLQDEVERDHGIAVEVVGVGDAPLDDRIRDLLAAAKEATVNSAKWSGDSTVSVYAEASVEGIAVFVRDRGRGFDPSRVPPDRKGLAESVRGRMARLGGSVEVRSAPGAGTEVELRLPAGALKR